MFSGVESITENSLTKVEDRIANKANVVVTSKWLGYLDICITLLVYICLLEKTDGKLTRIIEDNFINSQKIIICHRDVIRAKENLFNRFNNHAMVAQ